MARRKKQPLVPIPAGVPVVPVRAVVCPHCECPRLRVIYTRRWKDRCVSRKRECEHCGHHVWTVETVTAG